MLRKFALVTLMPLLEYKKVVIQKCKCGLKAKGMRTLPALIKYGFH